jgi:hypothetical protein
MRAFGLLLVLAGCAPTGSSVEEREPAGLHRELAARVAGEPRSCAPADPSRGLTVVDGRTVTVDQGATLWVNRLAADCPGLRPTSTIVAEVHGDRYCRGDRIRALDPGTTIPGPYCILADWTPYRRPR